MGTGTAEKRSLAGGAALAMVVAVLAVVTLGLAALLRGLGDARIPTSSLWALALVGAGAVLARGSRWGAGARGPVVASHAIATVAPWIFLGAAYASSEPLVQSSWRCGTGEMGLVVIAPFWILIAVMATSLVAWPLFARER